MSAPSGWRIGTLSDVVSSLRPGVSVDGEERTPAVGEVATLKTGAVLRGRFDPTQCKVVREVDASKAKTPVRAGTIILCRKNSEEAVGGSVLVQDDYPNLYLSDLLWEIRAADDADPRWLAGQLQSPDMRTRIRLAATGTQTTMKNISQDRLLGLSIPIPPLPEQRKIAEILRTWDDAIDSVTTSIQRHESKTQAVVAELFAHVGHRSVALGELVSPVKTKNKVGETNVLTSSGRRGLVSQSDYYSKNIAGADTSGYYLIERGDFAYNRSSSKGYPFGAIKRLDTHPRGVLSTLYLCFRPVNGNELDSDYLIHLFESGILNRQLVSICQEGARSHGLLNVTQADFFELIIPLPDMARQRVVAQLLNDAEAELRLLEQERDALRTQKRGLMQKLLSGEIRVQVS